MQIEASFTTGAITLANTNLDDSEEETVRDMIERVYASYKVSSEDVSPVHMDVALLCFIAGRTYQTDYSRIPILMTPEAVSRYLEFLTTPSLEE